MISSTLLIIKSEIFGLMLICLSDNVFEIMTFNRSSVGNSIPINKKLLILDFKSFKNPIFLIGDLELINI